MTLTLTPRITGAHVPRDAIGTALINSDPGLAAAGPLTTAAGAAAYLPQYRDATQREGDKVLFCPTLTEDGRLTLYLTAAAPAEIGARAAGAVAVSLGARVLRSETAPLAVLAALGLQECLGA